jgi:hypothetical protein
VAQTNQQIITEAFQILGVVREGRQPTPTQSANGMTVLNDNLLTQMRDGWGNLGWYPQTTLQLNSTAPLKDEDIADVKYCLAGWLGVRYGVTITPPMGPDDEFSLGALIKGAFRRLTKRYLKYTEADLGELSRPAGGPWGGPGFGL